MATTTVSIGSRSNTVDTEDDLCYDCESGICKTEQKILNGDDIYV